MKYQCPLSEMDSVLQLNTQGWVSGYDECTIVYIMIVMCFDYVKWWGTLKEHSFVITSTFYDINKQIQGKKQTKFEIDSIGELCMTINPQTTASCKYSQIQE